MEELIFREIADEYGPEKVVYVYEPRCGLRGIVVIDNTAAGPAIGGIRMAADVTTAEVFRLARAMTWKNALAGLPHGGGKSGILADPGVPNKEALIRQFARGIEALVGYIPGPDIGTDEVSMAWVRDEIGRSVGLSKVLGGIPLDQVGATGFGLAVCAEVAQDFCDVRLDGARVVVQGYGNVGSHTARYLAERGAVLVGASDVDGTVFDPDGIDIEELWVVKSETHRVTDYPRGQKLPREAFVDLPCDILVPAARPDALDESNVGRLTCKMVLQGANIAVTPGADKHPARTRHPVSAGLRRQRRRRHLRLRRVPRRHAEASLRGHRREDPREHPRGAGTRAGERTAAGRGGAGAGEAAGRRGDGVPARGLSRSRNTR